MYGREGSLLAGETPLQTLHGSSASGGQVLTLTNRRLIQEGTQTRALVLEGESFHASALLEEIDAVYAGVRYPNGFIALLGVLILLFGAFQSMGFGGFRPEGSDLLIMAIGVGLVLFWLLFNTATLEFYVDSRKHLGLSLAGIGGLSGGNEDQRAFIRAFYEARDAALAARAGGAASPRTTADTAVAPAGPAAVLSPPAQWVIVQGPAPVYSRADSTSEILLYVESVESLEGVGPEVWGPGSLFYEVTLLDKGDVGYIQARNLDRA